MATMRAAATNTAGQRRGVLRGVGIGTCGCDRSKYLHQRPVLNKKALATVTYDWRTIELRGVKRILAAPGQKNGPQRARSH
jgi:hypothetical protein